MKLLRLTESDLMSTKTIKSAFKIYLSNTCDRLQDRRLHLFSYLSPCHLSSVSFLTVSSISFWSYTFFSMMLLPNFIQALHTDRTIYTKNNLLVHCDDIFDGFFKLFFRYHTVWMGYILLLFLKTTSCPFIIL